MNSRTNRQLEALVKDFSKAEAWLVALVGQVIASGNLGQLRSRRRASREAAQMLDQLRTLTNKKAAALIKSGYLAGREVSGAPNKNLSEPDREALQLLIDNLGGRLQDGMTIVGRRIDDVFRREGLRAAALTLTESGAVDQRDVDRFRKRLQDQGVTSFIDSRGRRWRLETYAKMALKTTTMESVNIGAENLILERGFDIVEIGHTGPYKPDPHCDPHHGKKYSLTGRSKQFPMMKPEDRPPYHPYCEHFIKLAPEAIAERRRARRAA